eukprot:g9311.t1
MSNHAAAVAALGVDVVEKLKMEFRSRDRLQTGGLQLEEVAYILRSQGFCPTEAQLRAMLHQGEGETSSNINIGWADFLTGALKMGKPDARRQELYAFFAPYDSDGSGFVPTAVFRNLLENVGDFFPKEEVDEICDELNLTGNTSTNEQVVDYKGFVDLITQDL